MSDTLATLLDPLTVTEVFQTLLGVYQANGFPVQSWQTGGVERTRLMAIATAITDLSANYIPQIAAGGLLDYAQTLDNPAWLQLLASDNYSIEFNPATFTVGNITLTAASGVSTSTYTAGQLIAVFAASGNRYINTGSIIVPSGPGTVIGEFQAEFAGASYADPSSSGALTLSTAVPGVTLTNPATDYTDVAHVGAGTGTLTLGGSPVGPHQIRITVDSTGAVGVAAFSYSLDGSPDVSAGVVSTISDLGGTGVNVTFVNGGSGTSFVIGDTYLFNTPGSWITTQGSDIESNDALADRCRSRWSSLSPIPTSSFYELLVSSVPDVGSQVTQVIVLPDSVVNDRVNIVVAGPEGALPPDTIALIQTYVDPRVPLTEVPLVVSPSELAIEIGGIVTVTGALVTAVQGAVETALSNYVLGAGINGTLRIAKLIELIMEVTGTIDAASITINGASTNVTMGSTTTFVIAEQPTFTLTYVTA